ncbi:hypothetical protein N7462_009869 [Penicillium macrosclerotiorum]|uniref:uncharacterized protein n=1 Tax=Penicillium macrosclerotiorum TaxID=303699 RepID=UPI0025497EA8|nr:uncharacterized protein N7462_009869 [Penicillium macrosclerotiorum]KAJ5668799.1 hypothetical protein N7462_009869 [Penicillium macrosclerotiorum]
MTVLKGSYLNQATEMGTRATPMAVGGADTDYGLRLPAERQLLLSASQFLYLRPPRGAGLELTIRRHVCALHPTPGFCRFYEAACSDSMVFVQALAGTSTQGPVYQRSCRARPEKSSRLQITSGIIENTQHHAMNCE